MAKKAKQKKSHGPSPERLLYCSGAGWGGDGTKATSECPFNASRVLAAERYCCWRCTARVTRAMIYADANGPTESGLNTPLPTGPGSSRRKRKRRL